MNDFHFGVNKLISNNLNYWAENNLKNAGTSLGIPGFNFDTQYDNPGIPVITFGSSGAGVSGNYQTLGNAGSNWYQDDRTLDFYDELSWTHGKHTIMGGVEFRKLTLGREASNNPLGCFHFRCRHRRLQLHRLRHLGLCARTGSQRSDTDRHHQGFRWAVA